MRAVGYNLAQSRSDSRFEVFGDGGQKIVLHLNFIGSIDVRLLNMDVLLTGIKAGSYPLLPTRLSTTAVELLAACMMEPSDLYGAFLQLFTGSLSDVVKNRQATPELVAAICSDFVLAGLKMAANTVADEQELLAARVDVLFTGKYVSKAFSLLGAEETAQREEDARLAGAFKVIKGALENVT